MSGTELEFPTQVDLAHFLSVEAHDLRSPFNQIVGFSKLVINGQDGPLTDLQKEDLTTVYRSGLRAVTLMNNLIDMARLTLGEKSATPSAVAAAPLFDQALAQWKKYYPGRTLQVETKSVPPLADINADETQLKQILVNLMAYIAEFVEDPATLLIQAEAEAEWAVLTIESTGKKSMLQSALDLQLLGYVSRAFIELNRGVIRSSARRETGAMICIAFPK